jgi:putative lipoic acid-binding regulatory protein
LLDGVNSTSFARVDSSSTFTVATYFQSNLGATSGSLSSPPLQAYSTGGNSAFMSFHRGGYYAVNFGLDSDNVLRIGGWSAAANRWQLDMSGNMTAAGNVNSNSDIKLKTNIKTLTNSLDKVLQMRGVEFDRIDIEGKHQIGFIAQEIEKIYPELVSENQGTKSLSYGNITAILVEAIKEQQEQINNLKQEIQNLKK